MQKIYPYLWYEKNLKEILEYYKDIFPDMEITMNQPIEHTPSGVMESALINIKGQQMGVMAAGPMFKFTEAISFILNCDSQDEIDYYWRKLSTVPESEQCGWCKDRYGVSWQIVPKEMDEMMIHGTKEQIDRVVAAFMPMKKLDKQVLQDAFDGK
jgi:predicted 3-demethylubiquinone-9 3-methyltransferase (glyoxalase superfamily)